MKSAVPLKNHLSIHATTATVSAMLFNAQEQLLSKAFADIAHQSPEPGWAHVDPEEIWRATLQTCDEAIAKAGLYAEQIGTISIAAERGTAMLWDRVGKEALTPLIAQHDMRTQKIVEDWGRKKLDRVTLKRTGSPVDSALAGPKLVWLLAQNPGLRARTGKQEVLFGGIESWLLWKWTLGKVHATDYTCAAATMLFDLRGFRWDKRLLHKLKIPAPMMPQVKPSSSLFATTEQQGVLREGIPIGAVASDQAAALFALTGLEKGMAKVSYDKDCRVMVNIGSRPRFSKHGFATTPACSAAKRATYILEGGVPDGGWPVHWLRDSLRLVESIQETSAIAQVALGNRRMYFVANHGGGGIWGLRPDAKREDLVRAALEAVALEMCGTLKLFSKDAGTAVRSVFVEGPMSQNDFLLQAQANASVMDIARIKLGETACLGASYLAGIATRQYKSLGAIQRLRPIDEHFRCRIPARERKQWLAGWAEAAKKLQMKGRT